MIAIDTNILVYAKRTETKFHKQAFKIIKELAEGNTPWAIPWPCIYEYLRVITHLKVFKPVSNLQSALDDLESLFKSPSLVLLGQSEEHIQIIKNVILSAKAKGNLVHDAHIAALLREHGVKELLTADRDFKRFNGFKTTDPFK